MANGPKAQKKDRTFGNDDVKATADAGNFGSMSPSPAFTFEEEWTEADATAFIDDLVEWNKEALCGLAKL